MLIDTKTIRKHILTFICTFIAIHTLSAQIYNPVKWDFSLVEKKAGEADLQFTATIEDDWYVYDMNLPEGGPISTSFTFPEMTGAVLNGTIQATGQPESSPSAMFGGMVLRYYTQTVTFIQSVKISDKRNFSVKGSLIFMACDDTRCLSPKEVEFEFGSELLAESTETAPPTPSARQEETPKKTPTKELEVPLTFIGSTDTIATIQSPTATNIDLWQPVIEELRAYESDTTTSNNQSWWYIFIGGFIGGLLAFLTPCVWPMIPMTVSFFLKRTKSKKKSVIDTLLYALSIIVVYVALGLIITLLFGASALNNLSTNAVFNLLFFALLIFFAISFFGAFEIALPSSWTTSLNKKADSTTGVLSIFLMAFTLSLVSFSCTGPIIGTLLVEAAVSGSVAGPAIGMFGFALALATPFALFAFFPTWIQSMPKSGGWLNMVKITLGFLELALALKFLSVADLAYHWGILDREVFLVLWIIIFTLLGIYLLGKIRFAHDPKPEHVSPFRLFSAIISLSFALYMVPGLWGAPLKAISAFAPPLYTQDFNLYKGEVLPPFKDYDKGMEYAQEKQLPVLVDFTGYGCVNCRSMEASVWTAPRVKDIIDNEYVLISLYVDDKSPLEEIIEVEEAGKIRKLKTVGDKWSYLQRSKFGANAQPFYVLLNNEGFPIAPAYAYDKDINKYQRFLEKGLWEYKNTNK